MIDNELEFRCSTREGEPTLVWRDIQCVSSQLHPIWYPNNVFVFSGDVDELYEFVAAGTNEPTKAFFETCMYRAMYERKYKTAADNVEDGSLEEFMWM